MTAVQTPLWLLGICIAALLIYLVVERARHRRQLSQLPTRIVVNGIRGKSSVTRLIAGALRANTRRTVFAKTTGTAARLIYPNGREVPIRRGLGGVNVIEQIGVVRRAVHADADTLVIECMAVLPELQQVNQELLIESDIVVITNVREDHLEEMGPTLDDVARSLSRSMPHFGTVVTAERERLHILQEEADSRQSKLVAVDPDTVTDAEMRRFRWITFKENVALALAVAQLCGVDRATALKGMWKAAPDPGVLRVDACSHNGRRFAAVNLFAANDPASTLMNIRLLRERRLIGQRVAVVINCRPDRIERNGQMGSIIADIDPERVFLIGSPTRSASHLIDEKWRDRVVDLDGEHRTGVELRDAIVAAMGAGSTGLALLMIGNIHGRGEELLEALHQVTVAATAAAPFDELSHTLERIYKLDTASKRGADSKAPVDMDATVVLSRADLMATAVLNSAHIAVLHADRRRAARTAAKEL
ncbi:poly-gamma-glutamate synthase PgsB/CapB [Micromonospora purpureochromogenes]|uniref:Poly-gamma-glutamate synthase PgsB/CapB n=1 Tax=Micromonospora purpureochromogenes TaxID=47872 RepID=A0A1C5AHY5_9ACTN|nr:poly-gamma-glutamate synthase PgsB [Micromonospora purpureochromogenes]SCF44716.1 poly-gamma-glutamate synthase PgsB/CapB [Micromonospora purpureochromogenes]